MSDKKMVVRYRQPYNGKLFPVSAVITLVGIGQDRWACDDYEVTTDLRAGIIEVIEKRTQLLVKLYNSNRWLTVHFEYRTDTGTSWAAANKLEYVEAEVPSAGQS